MAGGLGGDDKDFSQYENNEEQESGEELKNNEETNNENNNEENTDGLTEELIQQGMQEAQTLTSTFEKTATNIENSLDRRFVPILFEEEKNKIEDGEKNKLTRERAKKVLKKFKEKWMEFIRNNLPTIATVVGILLAIFVG